MRAVIFPVVKPANKQADHPRDLGGEIVATDEAQERGRNHLYPAESGKGMGEFVSGQLPAALGEESFKGKNNEKIESGSDQAVNQEQV